MSTWLRRFHQSPGAPVRLVCFPHAGGAASYFFRLSKLLSPTVDVLGVQYPGRQDRFREPGIEDLGELADRVHEALTEVTDLPVAFFGHSLGATLAFEVARRMARPPLVLFASARRAPSRQRPPSEYVHVLDDERMADEVLRLSNGENTLLRDSELRALFLPALRSDYRAIETYRPNPPDAAVACPIVAVTGDADPMTPVETAELWREHTTGDFTLKVFPGGHFYLEKHADDLGRLIADTLSAAVVG